jgi:predicted dienelactone hydrolase
MLKKSLISLGVGLLSIVSIPMTGRSADQVQVTFGVFDRSISVQDLEAYAKSGVISSDLAAYLRLLPPETRRQLPNLLLAHADLDVVAISQFLYTPQGEILLNRLGDVIRLSSTQSGFYGIRAAAILGASEPKGLTLLNLLRKFPSPQVRIDLGEGMQIANEINQLVTQTQQAAQAIAALSASSPAPAQLPDSSQFLNLRDPGQVSWQKSTLKLVDLPRQREFPVDLYLPQTSTKQSPPLLVISHGLGEDKSSFAYLAEHLASHGFAIALPEHPGSNAAQIQNWLSGKVKDAAEPTEFIDRPLDIKLLLDELQQRSKTDEALNGRLDPENVGVIGHSLGGYTALALAGAPLDFRSLQVACQNVTETLNLSLLLQCPALQLKPSTVDFRDDRVKAIFTMNGLGSGILGQASMEQIQIPVLMMSSVGDTVAPALLEQIWPFTWLKTPAKYLTLIDQATHFSVVGSTSTSRQGLPIPTQVTGSNPAISKRYVRALNVAFFKTFVANQPNYRPYLSSVYAQALTVPPFSLSLIQSLTPDQLAQLLKAEESR